jgi:hypothetical protein
MWEVGFVTADVAVRFGTRVLEVVLLLAMASVAGLAVVYPVIGQYGLNIATGPDFTAPPVPVTLTVPVTTEPDLPQIGAGAVPEGDGLEIGGPITANVYIVGPALRQRIAVIGPTVLGGLVTVGVLFLLYQLVRSLRQGDPFRRVNARRLLGIAALVGVGGQAAVVLDAWGHRLIVTHPIVAPFVEQDVRLSFVPLLAGLGVAVAAEVFRQGARMREDLAGTV